MENTINLLLIVSTAAIAIIAITLFFALRRAKKSNRELTDKNENIRLLHKELHHRVKNSLQMLQSMLRVQARQLTDPAAIEALNSSQLRLQALVLAHQELFQQNVLFNLNLDEYLVPLTKKVIESLALENSTFVLEIDTISCNVDSASSMGLLFNELLTNTKKHGIPKEEKSVIVIKLKKENSKIHLFYSDNGPGITNLKGPDEYSSLGMQIIASITAQLNGNVKISNGNGTVFNFDFAIPELIHPNINERH